METCKKKNIIFQLGENTGKTDHIKLENNKDAFITEPISVYPSKRINSFITKKVTEYVRVNQILDKMSTLLENEIVLEMKRESFELKELKKFQEAIYNLKFKDEHIDKPDENPSKDDNKNNGCMGNISAIGNIASVLLIMGMIFLIATKKIILKKD